MIIALRIALFLGGALLLFLAAGFLIDPASAGADFGLSADSAHGLTSMRADFTAFFGVGGACLIWGALAKQRSALIIGAALMLITLAGRCVSLMIDGSFEGFLAPMIVEAVLGVLALVGAATLPAAQKRKSSIAGGL